jgi:hypothetical protein
MFMEAGERGPEIVCGPDWNCGRRGRSGKSGKRKRDLTSCRPDFLPLPMRAVGLEPTT